jgi:hypothetical protein
LPEPGFDALLSFHGDLHAASMGALCG